MIPTEVATYEEPSEHSTFTVETEASALSASSSASPSLLSSPSSKKKKSSSSSSSKKKDKKPKTGSSASSSSSSSSKKSKKSSSSSSKDKENKKSKSKSKDPLLPSGSSHHKAKKSKSFKKSMSNRSLLSEQDRASSRRLQQQQAPRRVRFNERHNQEFDDTVRLFEDCYTTWYNEYDFEFFRVRRREVLEQAQLVLAAATLRDTAFTGGSSSSSSPRRHNRTSRKYANFAKTLLAMYQTAANVDHILDSASSLLPQDPQDKHFDLMSLYQEMNDLNNDDPEEDDWLGLEVLLVLDIKRDVLERIQNVEQVVHDIQDEALRGLWDDVSDQQMRQELSDASRNFSQATGLFAQLLAMAQWHANSSKDTSKDHNKEKKSPENKAC